MSILGIFAVCSTLLLSLFAVRQFDMRQTHIQRDKLMGNLIESVPSVESFDHYELGQKEDFSRCHQFNMTNCINSVLRCVDEVTFDERLDLAQADNLEDVQIPKYNLQTSVWSRVFRDEDEINLLVSRSDGKKCLNPDQFRQMLNELRENHRDAYQGEVYALWQMFQRWQLDRTSTDHSQYVSMIDMESV